MQRTLQALELKIPPPLVAILIGLVMWWAAPPLPPVPLADPLRLTLVNACAVLAGACAVFGLTVALLGIWAFRRARTTISPIHPEASASVVKGGIYRYTRNPMYVGLTAVLVGWAVWLSISYVFPYQFLGPVALVLYLTRFQILPEERVMSAKFGRDYDDYSRRVRRWL